MHAIGQREVERIHGEMRRVFALRGTPTDDPVAGFQALAREPEGRFHSLAHRIDVPALERAYHRMRKNAAVGVDGVTKEQYGQDLEANLQDVHARMKAISISTWARTGRGTAC